MRKDTMPLRNLDHFDVPASSAPVSARVPSSVTRTVTYAVVVVTASRKDQAQNLSPASASAAMSLRSTARPSRIVNTSACRSSRCSPPRSPVAW